MTEWCCPDLTEAKGSVIYCDNPLKMTHSKTDFAEVPRAPTSLFWKDSRLCKWLARQKTRHQRADPKGDLLGCGGPGHLLEERRTNRWDVKSDSASEATTVVRRTCTSGGRKKEKDGKNRGVGGNSGPKLAVNHILGRRRTQSHSHTLSHTHSDRWEERVETLF